MRDEPNDDTPSRVGTLVAGKYRLEEALGSGGMGAVYRATHVFTERVVALKLLHAWVAANSPTAKTRLLEEAKAVSRLSHPAIVQVFDAGLAEDGAPYLVMEFLVGETLSQALSGGRLTQLTLIDCLAEILEALQLAHESGVIHRDLKPENIFLEERPAGTQARLLDFGIARRVDRPSEHLTQVGAIIGTPYYMSPEQLVGDPIDGRSDVYALGCVLFRGLSGRLPFSSAQLVGLLREVVERGAPSLGTLRPDLDPELIQVVDRALSRSLAARWPSAREFRLALLPYSSQRAALPERGTEPADPLPARPRPVDAGEARTVWRPTLKPPTPDPRGPRAWERALGELESEIENLKARHGATNPPTQETLEDGGWFRRVFKKPSR